MGQTSQTQYRSGLHFFRIARAGTSHPHFEQGMNEVKLKIYFCQFFLVNSQMLRLYVQRLCLNKSVIVLT